MSVNPMTWMTDSFSVIGNRPLQEISMPGSHDCGMSRLNNSTNLSDACNTQTQTIDVAGQLTLAGARYFDVRPILWDVMIGTNDASSNNVLSLYTGHFSTIPVAGWEGSAGQSLEDILSETSSFIQQPGCEKEIVIIKFSHYLYLSGITVGASPFTNGQFTQLITQVKARLQNQLFTSQTSDLNLNTITLADVVGGSGRIVAVFDALPDGFADPASGIFAYADYASPPAATNLTVFDCYADSESLSFMQADQLGKFQLWDTSSGALFLLSWTLTLAHVADYAHPDECILILATQALATLPDQMAVWQQAGYLRAQKFPNVIFTDATSTSIALTLCATYNSMS